jgi:hypothetical protein
MREIIFKNISYLYYPKGLCNIKNRDLYQKSYEFQRLFLLLNTFNDIDVNVNSIKQLESEFAKSELFKNFRNMTTFSFDRCLTYEFDVYINEKIVSKICLNISIVIPYYTIYNIENKMDSYSEKNKDLKLLYLKNLSKMIKNNLKFNKFPKNIISKIIPDLAFQDAKFGEFTYFNAFFQDANNN